MDYSKIDQVVKQGHADPSKHSLIIPSFLPPVSSVTSIDFVFFAITRARPVSSDFVTDAISK